MRFDDAQVLSVRVKRRAYQGVELGVHAMCLHKLACVLSMIHACIAAFWQVELSLATGMGAV